MPSRPLSDEAARSRLTEAVARHGWVTAARRLNVRHVQYLRQILSGARPVSEALRTALAEGV